MIEYISHSEQETSDIASDILNIISSRGAGISSTILALHGDLGSGKTAFTKMLARHFGVTETVVSPTFIIAKYYTLPPTAAWRKLIHIDAYRLDHGDDLRKLNFEREFADPTNLIVIEWPEKVVDILEDKDVTKINFEFVDEGTRKISYCPLEDSLEYKNISCLKSEIAEGLADMKHGRVSRSL
jgi:tRNA threonylcarbamoyladenosine biosynthesis protein TsaE